MSGAADEIEPPLAQLLVGLGDWVEQLELRREAFFLEESHLDRGDGGEIGRGNQVGNREAQAHWIPAARTASFQSSRSCRIAPANSAGVLQTASTPIRSSRPTKPASLHPSAISRATRPTISCGVPAGATTPSHVAVRNPGYPCSATVGTLGSCEARFSPDTASTRMRPLPRWGIISLRLPK